MPIPNMSVLGQLTTPSVFSICYGRDDCSINGPFADAESAAEFVKNELRESAMSEVRHYEAGGVFVLHIWPVRP